MKRKFLKTTLCAALIGAMVLGASSVNAEESKDYKTCLPIEVESVLEIDDQLYVYSCDGLFLNAEYNKETLYTTARLNIRKGPNTKSEVVTVAGYASELTCVGKTQTGWYIIEYEDEYRFVWGSYLAEEKPKPKPKPVEKKAETSSAKYSGSSFKRAGVINWNGYRWTWYSQRVLPGGGLKIPGRHVDGNGYVCDGDGYICLASNDLKKGTVVSTPFGKSGKIYDCGCASGTIDVYVNW